MSFLLVSLLPSAVITFFAFRVAGDAMQNQIQASVQQEAITASNAIEKSLFERLQNAKTWKGLEVIQDIKIHDLDKRLSIFLQDLNRGYQGVYQEIFCTDIQGKIVSSSNPLNIGRQWDLSSNRVADNYQFNDVYLEPILFNSKSIALPIFANVPSLFSSEQLGRVYLLFDWSQIYLQLDQASAGGHDFLLVDDSQTIIAASYKLRSKGFLLKKIPITWLSKNKNGAVLKDGKPLFNHKILVGYDHGNGFQKFTGFKWTVFVLEDPGQANIPVRKMALFFILLLVITSSVATALSLIVAGKISAPIAKLTQFTRQYMRDQKVGDSPPQLVGEVGQLTDAFVQTVKQLDQSRLDLIRASKLAVLGELAAVMSHEIRTPIGIIKSSAQLLSREKNLRSEAKLLTGFIETESDRLNKLATTILESARPHIPQFNSLDINQMINELVLMLESQFKNTDISITLSLIEGSAFVEADYEQIKQVLLNLIMNATQILGKNGDIHISTKIEAEDLVIQVEDNGPGIDEKDVSQIFDPFFTKRDGGFGLGLYVVQQIIKSHHGAISVDRSPLGGARFTIILKRDL